MDEEDTDNYEPDDETGDPGPSDSDYQGDKDSGTFSEVDHDGDSGRIDIYFGERGSADHGHIVTSEDDTADYVRDDDGEVYRDR